jgi:hypothetical protein
MKIVQEVELTVGAASDCRLHAYTSPGVLFHAVEGLNSQILRPH